MGSNTRADVDCLRKEKTATIARSILDSGIISNRTSHYLGEYDLFDQLGVRIEDVLRIADDTAWQVFALFVCLFCLFVEN